MLEYRGERGIRDYRREAKELSRIATVMAIICAIAVILAVALFFYTRDLTDRNITIPVIMPVMAMAESSLFTAHQVQQSHNSTNLPALIPMYWGAGVFFDPITYKIILPYDVIIADKQHNYLHYIYEITLEGINLPERRFPTTPLGIKPMLISQNGDSISLRTLQGVLMRYGKNAAYAYIQIVNPREAYHTIVIIDPGHGGIDTGAPSANGSNAPNEAEIVLAITLKLLEIFDEPGILLIPTRTTDIFLDNRYRYLLANAMGDYFISIHCNADARSRLSRGTLTLYGRAPGSHELAYAFQNALVNTLGSQNRGIHYAPQFRILNGSRIPVALLELLFISNPQEAAKLADPAIQMQIAQTLADTITTLPPARSH